MSVQVKVNYEDVVKRFQNILDLTQNFNPLFTKIVGRGENPEPWTLRGSAKFSFENEVDLKNKKWEKLSKNYKEYKSKNYSSDLPILLLTGYLYNSLVNRGKGNVFIKKPTSFIFGTSAIHATTHQFGDRSRGIPARPFLGFRKNQKLRIQLEIRKYIVNAYKRKQRIESGGGE